MLRPDYRVLLKESKLTKTTCKKCEVKVKLVNVALRK